MSEFLSRLVLEDEVGETMNVFADFKYYSSMLQGVVVVPAGFKTDFASIPRLFCRVLPKNGKYDRAAVIHDYLYTTAIVTKAEADSVFLEAMELCGVSWLERFIMFQAVNLFGLFAWNAHRREATA
jgi:hypothetical protein